MCARYCTGQPCSGDSGSSMVADRNADGIWVLYGVNSFGTMDKCNSINGYDGSTDVSAWTDQILTMVNNMGQG